MPFLYIVTALIEPEKCWATDTAYARAFLDCASRRFLRVFGFFRTNLVQTQLNIGKPYSIFSIVAFCKENLKG